MRFEQGRIFLTWGTGYAAAVDAGATDGDIEAAIRNAIKLPPVSLIPDAQPAPISQPKGTTMSVSSATAAGMSIKQMMEDHQKQLADLMEGHKAKMAAGFAKQMQAVQAVGSLAAKADQDGDDFLAMVGQFTNALGGE